MCTGTCCVFPLEARKTSARTALVPVKTPSSSFLSSFPCYYTTYVETTSSTLWGDVPSLRSWHVDAMFPFSLPSNTCVRLCLPPHSGPPLRPSRGCVQPRLRPMPCVEPAHRGGGVLVACPRGVRCQWAVQRCVFARICFMCSFLCADEKAEEGKRSGKGKKFWVDGVLVCWARSAQCTSTPDSCG